MRCLREYFEKILKFKPKSFNERKAFGKLTNRSNAFISSLALFFQYNIHFPYPSQTNVCYETIEYDYT